MSSNSRCELLYQRLFISKMKLLEIYCPNLFISHLVIVSNLVCVDDE